MDYREIELMLMRAWPSLEEITFDGWILRYSKGYTKRANCINPLYESCLDFQEKTDYCEKIYREKNLPVIYKLIDNNAGLKVDEFLEKKGFKKRETISVQELVFGKINFKLEDVTAVCKLEEFWLDFYTNENDLRKEEIETLKNILLKNEKNNIYVYAKHENKIVAAALGVKDGENIGIFNVFVKKEYRNQGYGKKVIEGLLAEAKKINAQKAYLQVLETNEKALNLYKKMGFVHKYSSWYRY